MRGTVAADVHGGVHIVHFYMGDSDDEFACNGSVRTVATCSDEESEHVHTILLESGADASIFPISLFWERANLHVELLDVCMMLRAEKFQLKQYRTCKSD